MIVSFKYIYLLLFKNLTILLENVYEFQQSIFNQKTFTGLLDFQTIQIINIFYI
jgi:hypothetical protein